MAHRSAKTGRYVSKGMAKRHPRTTVTEASGPSKGRPANRSAVTGRYVAQAAVRRHPANTVTER